MNKKKPHPSGRFFFPHNYVKNFFFFLYLLRFKRSGLQPLPGAPLSAAVAPFIPGSLQGAQRPKQRSDGQRSGDALRTSQPIRPGKCFYCSLHLVPLPHSHGLFDEGQAITFHVLK